MKKIKLTSIVYLIFAGLLLMGISACNTTTEEPGGETGENETTGEMTPVTLTIRQTEALSIKTDTMAKYIFKNVVVANGYLNVPPQNKASVTAIIGANVASINVFEGDKVQKGALLAYLKHPDLLDIQTEYLNAVNQLDFLQQEFERQKKLYNEKVGSGKAYQKARADYFSLRSDVLNLEAKLKLLNLNPGKIKKGTVYEKIPVISPIEGYIEKVEIRTGQYVEPQMPLFEVVNTGKVHADLMVFEKDVYKVKKGQKVLFNVESIPGKPLTATIFAVGKTFEQNPKAVHVHAEIDNKRGALIPGMYITGRIATENKFVNALPEEAVVTEDGKSYIFTVEKNNEAVTFTPVEVVTGEKEDGWVEIKLLSLLKPGVKIAQNGAYYILSEMKKSETGDDD